MAKIAGRKNDGAWYRMNQYLITGQMALNNNFATAIKASQYFEPAFNDVSTYASTTGAVVPDQLGSTDEWAASISIGIPRQIWDGVTTYDYYTHDAGTKKYSKLMQGNIFKLSVDIRAAAKTIRFGELELELLSELGSQKQPADAAFKAMSTAEKRAYKFPIVLAFLKSEEGLAALERRKNFLTIIADESKSPLLGGGTPKPTSRMAKSRA